MCPTIEPNIHMADTSLINSSCRWMVNVHKLSKHLARQRVIRESRMEEVWIINASYPINHSVLFFAFYAVLIWNWERFYVFARVQQWQSINHSKFWKDNLRCHCIDHMCSKAVLNQIECTLVCTLVQDPHSFSSLFMACVEWVEPMNPWVAW